MYIASCTGNEMLVIVLLNPAIKCTFKIGRDHFEIYSIHLFNYSLKSKAFRKPKSNYQVFLNILKLLKMIQQLL